MATGDDEGEGAGGQSEEGDGDGDGDGDGGTTVETTRQASNINLDTTVLHVPETVKQTRPSNETTDTSYRDKYPFLYTDDDDDGEPDTPIAGTGEFWALPYCDPDYNDFEWATGDMCMGFSAGLLHAHHFLDGPDGKPPGKIYWEVESEREPGIAYNDEGQVFLFYPHDLPEVTRTDDPLPQVTWNSFDMEKNTLEMDPGTYEHRQWGFTKPGTYVLSVHAKGYPAAALGAVGAQSVSSVPRLYTFHVGLLADLKVTATADDSAPDPGDEVTLTITASSKGPDAADNTKVVVHLPEGLTVSTTTDPDPSTGTYDSVTGVWDVGDMAAPGEGETATTETLTLTVTVADNAVRGEALKTDLEIYATEDIGNETHVRELDPHTHDNDGDVIVTPAVVANAAPIFHVSRSIAENSAAGTNVGALVTASDSDGDALTYTLTGTGADQFTVAAVATGAQVSVASGAYLNYEDTAAYDLVLNVSDGKDAAGNADTAIDHYIGLTINVTDAASETLAITLTADPTTQTVNGEVQLTTTVSGSEVPNDMLSFSSQGRNKTGDEDIVTESHTLSDRNPTVTYGSAVQREYTMAVWQSDDYGGLVGSKVTSAPVTVTWTNE